MIVIGISGYVNSGKDTLAMLIEDQYKGEIKLDSFAAPMRSIAYDMYLPQGRDRKEVEAVRIALCYQEVLQRAIESALGYLPDNDKAQLYALTWDALVQGGYMRSADSEDFDDDFDTLRISPRVFLQILGQCGREVRPDFWINAFQVRNLGVDVVLCSDVRYEEEHAVCTELIWVERDGTGPVNGHKSEQYYDTLRTNAYFTVGNNGTLQSLRVDAGILADFIWGRYGK